MGFPKPIDTFLNCIITTDRSTIPWIVIIWILGKLGVCVCKQSVVVVVVVVVVLDTRHIQ